jgi:hypothetical protein
VIPNANETAKYPIQIGIPSRSPLTNQGICGADTAFSLDSLEVSVIVTHNLWYNCLRCEYVLYHYQKNSAPQFEKKKEEIMLPEDPDMLASFLNMKLRDHYPTLDALCEDLELDKEKIVGKLKEADYDYIPARNQFL